MEEPKPSSEEQLLRLCIDVMNASPYLMLNEKQGAALQALNDFVIKHPMVRRASNNDIQNS